MNAREIPPQLRDGIRADIEFLMGDRLLEGSMQINFFPEGRAAEVFCRPFHTGAHIEDALDRFCVLVSVALQHGVRLQDLAKTMGDDIPPPVAPGGRRVPENVFSAIIRMAAQLEAELLAVPEPA